MLHCVQGVQELWSFSLSFPPIGNCCFRVPWKKPYEDLPVLTKICGYVGSRQRIVQHDNETSQHALPCAAESPLSSARPTPLVLWAHLTALSFRRVMNDGNGCRICASHLPQSGSQRGLSTCLTPMEGDTQRMACDCGRPTYPPLSPTLLRWRRLQQFWPGHEMVTSAVHKSSCEFFFRWGRSDPFAACAPHISLRLSF